MIKKIKKIKNFAIFKEFKWDDKIDEFRKYNLIYGWNYSGKTTISRIFRNLEIGKLSSHLNNYEFSLEMENGLELNENNFSSHPYQFRVFNIDFIKQNLYWESQEANPIFVLGEKDIEQEKQLKRIREEIDDLKRKKILKMQERDNVIEEINKGLANKAREIDRLKSPYDRRKLKNILEKIKDNIDGFCLNEREVRDLIRSVRTERKEKIPKSELSIIKESQVNEVMNKLKKTIVSETIERLEKNPEINAWVREGLKIHKGKSRCEFCGAPLSRTLIQEYERHFSEEYDKIIDNLSNLRLMINKFKNEMVNYGLPDEARFYPKIENSYKNKKHIMQLLIRKYVEDLEELINLLDRKIKNPFERIQKVPDLLPIIKKIETEMGEINRIIEEHNEISDKHNEKQNINFSRLEKHYAAEFAKNNNYFDKEEKVRNIRIEIEKIGKEIEEKEEQVVKIEMKLSDISKAAIKINNYLKSIFGREHLKIFPTERNKFRILRNGRKAINLSEGEKTAIAFAYFLTRLEDKETNLPEAKIFIDDPISSLDSSHLYNTYALIESKLSNCKQLFIATHNLEFFNLIKEWMKNMGSNKEKCRYYLVERITKNKEEKAILRNLPNVLLNYKSEYHFLFSKLKTFYDTPRVDFENLYQLPNIVRRFLEAFVGFKYSQGLRKGLELLIDEENERIRVNKFVNYLSHQTGLQRNLIFNDLSESRQVVNIVINSIRTKDPEHYKALESVFNEQIN